MKKAVLTFLFIICALAFSKAQEPVEGQIIKDSLYVKFKKEVINYSLKDFDKLFFEFNEVANNVNNPILTEVQYYSYTIKIAAFSDRWASLYPKEKKLAMQNKKEWFSKKYSDYLKTRKK